MDRDAVLPTFRLEAGTSIAQAAPWAQTPVTLDSPALDVMTDLTLVKAATTQPSTTLRQAEQMMIYQGVRMLFVVTQMPFIEGLVTTTDLHGDTQMRAVHDRRVRGVISRAQIERQLGAPIAITPIASSFSEIERALA